MKKISIKRKVGLDESTYLKSFRLAVENAQRLHNGAIVLEEKKDFGIVNSLIVLSAEEGRP